MLQITMHGENSFDKLKAVAAAISTDFAPFGSGASLKGRPVKSQFDNIEIDQMPRPLADRLNAAHKRGDVSYVIWSYETPIAWLENVAGEVQWVMPTHRYSPTTSKHQGKIAHMFHYTRFPQYQDN